jgi:type III secretory pathway component EscU
MAAPAPPFIVVDLSASWGAASIGNYLAMALLAFQFAQTFYYLHKCNLLCSLLVLRSRYAISYREDRWVMKSMAVLLLALSVAQQVEITKSRMTVDS